MNYGGGRVELGGVRCGWIALDPVKQRYTYPKGQHLQGCAEPVITSSKLGQELTFWSYIRDTSSLNWGQNNYCPE
jgi:hypothetical protein